MVIPWFDSMARTTKPTGFRRIETDTIMTDLVKAKITTIDKNYIRSSVDIAKPASETVVLRGKFKHNGSPNARFAVYTSVAPDKPITQDGLHACLSAMGSVISSSPGENPTIVDVKDGDLIEVDGKLYNIRDDRALADPRLELVAGPLEFQAEGSDKWVPVADNTDDLFTSDPWRPDNDGTAGDLTVTSAGTIKGGEVDWVDNVPDVIDEDGTTADEDAEIYGGNAIIAGRDAMTFWHDRFEEVDGVTRSVYGVSVNTDDGSEWQATDIYAPDSLIDVDEARRVIASMLLEEVNQTSGKWDSDLITWAIHNSDELHKVAVS
jgi:hypothetical protein